MCHGGDGDGDDGDDGGGGIYLFIYRHTRPSLDLYNKKYGIDEFQMMEKRHSGSGGMALLQASYGGGEGMGEMDAY